MKREHLTIKTYYFPTGQSLRVKYAAVKGLYYAPQGDTLFVAKGWGQSFTPVW